MELDGQVAIVTGAGRGIGRAIALELAAQGAAVVVAEFDAAAAERVATELRAVGRTALTVPADVTNVADLRRLVTATMDAHGRIDILVNNAGIFRAAPLLDVTEQHWDEVLGLNARAVFFASQAVLPHMLAARRGCIVNIASMAGKMGSPTSLAYAASKAAVISVTRSLALGVAASGVRVNCVCPGFVDTAMWAQLEEDVSAIVGMSRAEFHERRLAQIPLGRWETPDDVARVVAFLASERAGYVTGEALNVSGGLVMH